MKLSKSESFDESQDQGGRRRLLVAGGIVAALAAVGAMALMFLPGGDDAPPGSPTGAGPVSTVSTTGAPTPAPTSTAIKKFTGSNARDPFKALVVEAAAAPAGVPAGSSTVTTGPTGVVGGVSTASPGTSTVPVPTSSVTSTPKVPTATAAPVTKISMVAVAAGDTSARIKVNSTFYDVKPLAEFATYFKLLNLRESKCGAVQYGDTIFDLCEGQTRTIH